MRPLHIALCATILAGASWAAPPVSSSQSHTLAEWPEGAGAPAFTLVDPGNIPRSLKNNRGRVVVIVFGFLHCPDTCPAELFKLALVEKQLGQAAAHVQVLFITLDPVRDTPKLLETYVSAFDPRFVGLTGTVAQVDQAASSFNVQYAHVPLGNEYTIDHSTAIFVVDGAGRLRLIGGADSSAADFAHDIIALLREQQGAGGNRQH